MESRHNIGWSILTQRGGATSRLDFFSLSTSSPKMNSFHWVKVGHPMWWRLSIGRLHQSFFSLNTLTFFILLTHVKRLIVFASGYFANDNVILKCRQRLPNLVHICLILIPLSWNAPISLAKKSFPSMIGALFLILMIFDDEILGLGSIIKNLLPHQNFIIIFHWYRNNYVTQYLTMNTKCLLSRRIDCRPYRTNSLILYIWKCCSYVLADVTEACPTFGYNQHHCRKMLPSA